jgi:hypothetical protein
MMDEGLGRGFKWRGLLDAPTNEFRSSMARGPLQSEPYAVSIFKTREEEIEVSDVHPQTKPT